MWSVFLFPVEQIGALFLGNFKRLFCSPFVYLCVIAGDEYVGHALAVEFIGACILRIFKPAARDAFVLIALFVRKDSLAKS